MWVQKHGLEGLTTEDELPPLLVAGNPVTVTLRRPVPSCQCQITGAPL
jgi:hypothetical protein